MEQLGRYWKDKTMITNEKLREVLGGDMPDSTLDRLRRLIESNELEKRFKDFNEAADKATVSFKELVAVFNAKGYE